MKDKFELYKLIGDAIYPMWLWFYSSFKCRNPSLGLATKGRGCKVAGQEGYSGAHHILLGVQRV